jgi:hypothetical protein
MNRNVPVPFLGEERAATLISLPDPSRHRKRQKVHYGYQTGDMIRAVVPAGLKTQGTHSGRVLARATGSFDISTKHGRVAGVGYRYCRPIHRNDGYSY